jgi:integrase
LLRTAEAQLLEALANDSGSSRASNHRHKAEQDLLLTRLAADSGARRGELAVLRFEDLRGRVLHVQRGISETTITTPKSGHPRSLTLGAGTARLWHTLEADWRHRSTDSLLGPWVFSAHADHRIPMTPSALGHRFARLRDRAGVADASLHRLRHSVATFLVARGKILQAQARLGHADAATTLREYAYALPLADTEIADHIDRHLDRQIDEIDPAVPLPETDPPSLPS